MSLSEKFQQLAEAPPKLHFWGGEWRVGGFGVKQIQLLGQSAVDCGPRARVIETGAGLSTLLLLALDCRVTSFFTKEDLRNRIRDAIVEHDLPLDNWDFRLGSSEFTLPKYLTEKSEPGCDLVLVDGGHLIHTVFTDFTFGFAALRQNGIMLVDDLQDAGVNVLYQILKSADFMEEVGREGKLASFRKKTSALLPGGWGEIASGSMNLTGVAAGLNAARN